MSRAPTGDSLPAQSDRSAEPTTPLGLIGIGLMGTAIAGRLLGSGWNVVGWDVERGQCSAFQVAGGTVAGGIVEVFGSCDRVLLSLPTDEIVAEVLQNANDVFHRGQILIDTSTGAPEAAEARAKALALRGVAYLDATVSGSSQQLRDGVAVLMVGADDLAFQACQDLFACLAPKTFHTGPPGSGARMKLVTNLVLGLNRVALAEGLAFAEAIGVETSAALEVLVGSMAYSRVMGAKGRKMLEGDFAPQAKLSQHLKDVRLMIRAATEAGLTLPLSETHRGLLERAEEAGWGDLDNSVVIRAIRETRP